MGLILDTNFVIAAERAARGDSERPRKVSPCASQTAIIRSVARRFMRIAAGYSVGWLTLARLVLVCPVAAAVGADPPGPRDVTFIVTSDAHYDAFENEDRNDRVRDTLRVINAVTNLAWPESLGGSAIARPRGVLLLGDVIDDGDRVWQGKHQTPRQYRLFLADFGFDGTDGLLDFPVFETWGNHDGPPVGREKFGFSFQAHLKERNLRRQERGWLSNLIPLKNPRFARSARKSAIDNQ